MSITDVSVQLYTTVTATLESGHYTCYNLYPCAEIYSAT